MQKSVLFMGLGYIGLPTAALVADAITVTSAIRSQVYRKL